MTRDSFTVTERISWSETNFIFKSYKALADGIKKAVSLKRLTKDKEYRIIIQEVV